MAGFKSWFSRRAPQSKPTSQAQTNSNILVNRVIGGRVTKPTSKPTSSDTGKGYQKVTDKMGNDAKIEAIAKTGQASENASSSESKNTGKETAGLGDGGELVDEPSVRNARDFLSLLKSVFGGSRQEDEEVESSSGNSGPPTPESSSEEETDDDHGSKQKWRYEQVFLNEILRERDRYTLMPTTWRMHFLGIPLPEGLFYTQTRTRAYRPRIYALTEGRAYQGATALRRLMEIHGRILDLRKEHNLHPEGGYDRRMTHLIKHKLESAIRWSEIDGGLGGYKKAISSNVLVMEMDEAKRLDMDTIIQGEMAATAEVWRLAMNSLPSEELRALAPPVLFGFVIYKHIVFIVTLDSQNPKAACHIPCQLDLSEGTQRQWNALALMVTICWARDSFRNLVDKLPPLEPQMQEIDPDL
ncbi:hypothetical protein GGS26DRAFT_547712 [Hypomontagnella submonticulosa]|nr:hypothetical protein GGS26DRAFT_547712 [Hypomontagnella submonticulosa]